MMQTLDRLLLENVEVEQVIGEGNFGKVYRGSWNGATVAIKGVKNEDDFQDNMFKEEIILLQKLNHPNVVRLLGVHIIQEDSSLNMVLEYAANGSLDGFLKKNSDDISTEHRLSMCMDLVNGMVFLQSKSIIHRDLAARNLLLDDALRVKISDFGLSREDNVYSATNAAIPYRWAAPEVMIERVSTTQSDVWSFGVTVWEIFSNSAVPYRTLTNREVSELVPKGTRLEQPEECPPAMWEIVCNCWELKPDLRPTFAAIRTQILAEFGARLSQHSRAAANVSYNQRGSILLNSHNASYHAESSISKIPTPQQSVSHYDKQVSIEMYAISPPTKERVTSEADESGDMYVLTPVTPRGVVVESHPHVPPKEEDTGGDLYALSPAPPKGEVTGLDLYVLPPVPPKQEDTAGDMYTFSE